MWYQIEVLGVKNEGKEGNADEKKRRKRVEERIENSNIHIQNWVMLVELSYLYFWNVNDILNIWRKYNVHENEV